MRWVHMAFHEPAASRRPLGATPLRLRPRSRRAAVDGWMRPNCSGAAQRNVSLLWRELDVFTEGADEFGELVVEQLQLGLGACVLRGEEIVAFNGRCAAAERPVCDEVCEAVPKSVIRLEHLHDLAVLREFGFRGDLQPFLERLAGVRLHVGDHVRDGVFNLSHGWFPLFPRL